MPDSQDRSEVIALAKAIHRRILDWEEASGQEFKIDDTLSRVLENDPDYTPYRKRKLGKKRGPSVAPGVFTIKRIADQLDTTVGDLLGEREFDVTIGDRRRIRELLDFLRQRLALDTIEALEPQSLEYRFPIPFARFKERDYDYPQALHAWVVPEFPMAAGPGGIEPERPLMTTDVLHSIRDVRNGALQVIKVIGDSMSDLLLDGYKILVDTRLKKPRTRDVVAVYIKAEGGVMGYWQEQSGGKVVLEKHNPDYEPVPLGHRTEWFLVGTVTKIVEAPLPRDRD
jgi:phage repressor protein C with HTH and peptisase S24 domain